VNHSPLTTAGIVILVNAAVVTGPIVGLSSSSRAARYIKVCDLVVILWRLWLLGVQPLWAMDTTSRSILIVVPVL
jgi:hypothetical protein